MDFTWMYFSTNGRISRKQFWIYNLLLNVPFIAFALSCGAFLSENSANEAIIVAQLVLFWPSVSVQAKRWHDRGKSAAWILIGLVPIIGGLWTLIELGILSGQEGDNEYGASPLEIEPPTLRVA